MVAVSMSKETIQPSMSPEERKIRIELAACYRLIAHFGMDSLIGTHSTARIPGPEHHFLINRWGLHFSEITASNLVKIDTQGNILDPNGGPINKAGFVIHSALHMAREDARCVIHTHTPAGMAIAALECGLLPVSVYGLDYYGKVSYHDYEGPSTDTAERERLIADMGENDVMILRNHGLLVCGDSVAAAFVRMLRLEIACQVQLSAQATGTKLVVPSPEICAEHARRIPTFWKPGKFGAEDFEAFMRIMDAKDPSYRQ